MHTARPPPDRLRHTARPHCLYTVSKRCSNHKPYTQMVFSVWSMEGRLEKLAERLAEKRARPTLTALQKKFGRRSRRLERHLERRFDPADGLGPTKGVDLSPTSILLTETTVVPETETLRPDSSRPPFHDVVETKLEPETVNWETERTTVVPETTLSSSPPPFEDVVHE